MRDPAFTRRLQIGAVILVILSDVIGAILYLTFRNNLRSCSEDESSKKISELEALVAGFNHCDTVADCALYPARSEVSNLCGANPEFRSCWIVESGKVEELERAVIALNKKWNCNHKSFGAFVSRRAQIQCLENRCVEVKS